MTVWKQHYSRNGSEWLHRLVSEVLLIIKFVFSIYQSRTISVESVKIIKNKYCLQCRIYFVCKWVIQNKMKTEQSLNVASQYIAFIVVQFLFWTIQLHERNYIWANVSPINFIWMPIWYTFFCQNNLIDAQRPPNKRRKRKGSNSGSGANNAPPVPSKKRSPGPNFSLASQVVVSFSFLYFSEISNLV